MYGKFVREEQVKYVELSCQMAGLDVHADCAYKPNPVFKAKKALEDYIVCR